MNTRLNENITPNITYGGTPLIDKRTAATAKSIITVEMEAVP